MILSSERDVVLTLGHKIIDRTRHGMRVFPSSLVATVMLQCRNGLPLDELVRRVEWLRHEIVTRGGTVHWITGEDNNAGGHCVVGGERRRALCGGR